MIDVFVDDLDISGLGFKAESAHTGRPAYHARTLLKPHIYGYVNQVHSSRRLEREAQRNVELNARGSGIVGYNVRRRSFYTASARSGRRNTSALGEK